jgi:uncharacterized protein YndB with AHSA1/START domain
MQFRRFIRAPRARVYQMLVDPIMLAKWKVPDNMSMHIHELDAREGGRLRVSLTYDDDSVAGKSNAATDTYHGEFERLVPNELVVERDEFETSDPAFQGTMTSTFRLADAPGGTELVATHDGLPPGIRAADNELGWQMALDKLTALAERHGSESAEAPSTVHAAEQALRSAQLRGDVATLSKLIDDRLLFTGPDGLLYSKGDDLAAHRAGDIRIEQLEPREEHVLELGDIVVVSVRMDMRGSFKGRPFAGPARYTRVWRLTDRGWKVVAGHVSPITAV